MHPTALLRLVALARLERVFSEIRVLPWDCNGRTGVVRIGNEPLVIPRGWLRHDPEGHRIEAALRDAWDIALQQPVRPDICNVQLWHLTITAAVNAGTGTVIHIDGDWPGEYPLGEDSARPDFAAMLPELLRITLWNALTRFAPADDEDPDTDDFFLGDLVQAILLEIDQRMNAATFNEAMMVLTVAAEEDIDEVFPEFSQHSSLCVHAQLVADLCRAATAWQPHDQPFSHFLPFAVLAGHAATPDGIRAWLGVLGFPRKALRRLHHLPPALLTEITSDWAANTRGDYQNAVLWLGKLLALLHEHRRLAIDTRRVCSVARIATAAGLIGATLEQQAEQEDDRRKLPEYGANFIDDPGIEDSVIASMDALCVTNPGVGATFALTMMRELLRASAARLALMHEHIGDVTDWIRGGYHVMGDAGNLTHADVWPDWQTLMRGQRRWHQRWAAHGIRFPREPLLGVQSAAPEPEICWESPCDGFALGEFIAVPLLSSTDLHEEGRALGHCVATYWPRCAKGDCSLFSIRSAADGNRLGTVEFNWHSGSWRLEQFRGRRNAQLLTRDGLVKEPYMAVIDTLLGRMIAGLRRVA